MLPVFLPLTAALVPRPWGGTKLKSLKGITSSVDELIGESWEVSLHRDGPSTYQNHILPSTINFDYLVKFIEAKENLSVQVHPHDDYAQRVEKSWGKTECWLILEAMPGAGIYLGFAAGVTREIFEKAVRAGEDLRGLLRFHQVHAGDFFYVPAGSVHAIGAGITLAEIQQSSGITYRVWDWNRRDAQGKMRELHIDKALDVLNFNPEAQSNTFFRVKRSLFNQQPCLEQKPLLEHPQFSIILSDQSGSLPMHQSKRPAALVVLAGEVILHHKVEQMAISAYHSALVLEEEVKLVCQKGARYLWVY